MLYNWATITKGPSLHQLWKLALPLCAFVCLLFILCCSSEIALADDNTNDKNQKPLTPAEVAALIEENRRLKEEAEKNKKKKKPDPDEDDEEEEDETDLNARVAKSKKDKEEQQSRDKSLERALTFNMQSDKFIKDNESILPKDMASIFDEAKKQKYDSQIEQANAIKSALISKFFSIQANLDALTDSQKSAIEDFSKLTVKAKQESADSVFTNIFEPALATTRAIKKAEEVTKANSGLGAHTDSEKKYAERMTKYSQSHYLGTKHEP